MPLFFQAVKALIVYKIVSHYPHPQIRVDKLINFFIELLHASFDLLMIQFFLMFLFNPLPAKLFNLNFHPLEVVLRWRDPQLQVSDNYSDLT